MTMGFFRRKSETLNEQMLREAGLGGTPPASEPLDGPAPFDSFAGTYPAEPEATPWDIKRRAMPRPAEDDVATTAHAPKIAGAAVEFATLPSGDLIVDEEQGDADLGPLADAIEKHLSPPYRATGRRESGDLWAVAARRIVVLTFPCEGDEIELVSRGGESTLRVDGAPSTLRVPELESAGAARGDDYAVEATRLDGDLWEVTASAL